MKAFLRETIIILVLAAVIYGLLYFVIQGVPVIGSSMEPNLASSGQRVLINRTAYWFHGPQRGDIVTLHPPTGWYNPTGRPFIKRIIGLPGETVEIKNGKVYINGNPLIEPYLDSSQPMTRTMPAITVPAGYYFVLGDNRNVSEDSSYYRECISRSSIIGKAWLSYWPLSSWGAVANYHFPN